MGEVAAATGMASSAAGCAPEEKIMPPQPVVVSPSETAPAPEQVMKQAEVTTATFRHDLSFLVQEVTQNPEAISGITLTPDRLPDIETTFNSKGFGRTNLQLSFPDLQEGFALVLMAQKMHGEQFRNMALAVLHDIEQVGPFLKGANQTELKTMGDKLSRIAQAPLTDEDAKRAGITITR